MLEKMRAKDALKNLQPVIEKLDRDIAAVENIPDPIDRLVSMFGVISPLHDQQKEGKTIFDTTLSALEKANGSGGFNEQIDSVKLLQSEFVKAGRNEYGWNRTQPGQNVTADHVYLGNISGRFTHPASKWKSSFSKTHPHADEDRQIIGNQAGEFVADHAAPIHKAIAKLKI